jgi:cell division protein FtsQ
VAKKPETVASLRRKKTLQRNIRIGVIATAILVAAQVVFFSSALAVEEVSVVGNHFALPQDVIDAAKIELGTPIARLDTAAIEKRINALPAVASVEIRRAWPHHIVLAVYEPTPVAVVGSAKNWQYVDVDGEIFGKLSAKPKGFLTLTAGKQTARKAAAEVATGLPQWLADRVVTIRATTKDDVKLNLKGGVEVRFGSSERIDRKAQVLKALFKVKARIYDVTAPDVPITIK